MNTSKLNSQLAFEQGLNDLLAHQNQFTAHCLKFLTHAQEHMQVHEVSTLSKDLECGVANFEVAQKSLAHEKEQHTVLTKLVN